MSIVIDMSAIQDNKAIARETLRKTLNAMIQERAWQWEKYESKPGYQGHSVAGWLFLIRKEMEEAEDALIRGAAAKGGAVGRDHVLHEILQVATLCVACLQQHGLDVDAPMRSI